MKRGYFLSGIWILFSILFFTAGCNTELNRARKLKESGQYESAADFYEKALKKDPENVEALKEITEIYCEKLKKKYSIKCFEKAEKLYKVFPKDPKVKEWYADSLFKFAKSLFYQMRLERAAKYLQTYLKLKKNPPAEVFYMLADAKFRPNKNTTTEDEEANRELRIALQYYKKAIELSKPDTKVQNSFNPKKQDILQWEAYMKIGRIYELWLLQKYLPWKKKVDEELRKKEAAKAKQKKKKRRRRRRRVKKKEKKERPVFPLTGKYQKYFEEGIKAYKKAIEVPQPDKYRQTLPYLQIALFYARFKAHDYNSLLEAVKWLKEAEKINDTDINIIGNLKMIYDMLKEMAEENGDKKKAAEFDKLSQNYDSKAASLRGEQ